MSCEDFTDGSKILKPRNEARVVQSKAAPTAPGAVTVATQSKKGPNSESAYRLNELKKIMKDNGIKGTSIYKKDKIIEILEERNLLPPKRVKVKKEKVVNEIEPKFEYLRKIRTNPRSVIIRNIETGEVVEYPSLYRASKAIGRDSRVLIYHDGSIIDEKYEVNIQGGPDARRSESVSPKEWSGEVNPP